MRTKVLLLFLIFSLLSTNSEAVPHPEKIKWKASPTAFITSLYQGVLGRNPENRSVVNSWATAITSQKSSRLNVFWKFINSREYQTSRWAKQRKEYAVYYKFVGTHKKKTRYYTSKHGTDHYISGNYTFGVAMSIRDYKSQFDSRSESYNKQNNRGINLLGVPVN